MHYHLWTFYTAPGEDVPQSAFRLRRRFDGRSSANNYGYVRYPDGGFMVRKCASSRCRRPADGRAVTFPVVARSA